MFNCPSTGRVGTHSPIHSLLTCHPKLNQEQSMKQAWIQLYFFWIWLLSLFHLKKCESLSHVWFFATPWTIALRLCPWNSPGKNTGVASHSLLQGNLPNAGIESMSLVSLLQCRRILYCLSQKGSHFSLKYHIFTYIDVYMCIHTQIYLYIYIGIYVCVCVYLYTQICTMCVNLYQCYTGRLGLCSHWQSAGWTTSSGYSEAYAATFYSMSYMREKLDFSSSWVPNSGKYKN